MEVTGRRGRRRKKLLDDLKERRGYSHLKDEALDRTMWRNRFGRGVGPVVRQITEWMNGEMWLCVVEGFCWVAGWCITTSMSALTLSLFLRFLWQNIKFFSCVMNVRIMTGFLMAFTTHLKLFNSNDIWRIKPWLYWMFVSCEEFLSTPGSK